MVDFRYWPIFHFAMRALAALSGTIERGVAHFTSRYVIDFAVDTSIFTLTAYFALLFC